MADVEIVYPNGARATVPEGSLSAALAEGARIDTHTPESRIDDGGLVGGLAAGILGAGSTATLGATDKLLREGAYVFGGAEGAREVTSNLRAVREANPNATMAGEFAGLLVNPEAVSGLGEAAGGAVAARAGEGLLGKIAESVARNSLEAAMLGAQHQITEDSLGDHELNAEAILSSASKDALLGAALGVPLGAGSYGLGRARGLLSRSPGPLSDAVLDEVAGAPGAGRGLRDAAREAEGSVEALRRTGATTEQATDLVGDLDTLGKARGRAVFLDQEALDAGLLAPEGPVAPRPIKLSQSYEPIIETRRVPLSDIEFQPPWDPYGKLNNLRRQADQGVEFDPVRLARGDDGEYKIADGIHRTALARERGLPDVLARTEDYQREASIGGQVYKTTGRVASEPAPIRFGAAPAVPADADSAMGRIAGSVEAPPANGTGLLDDVVKKYAGMHGGDRAATIEEQFRRSAARALDHESLLDAEARKLADAGTRVARLEDTINELHFTERPDQLAKKLDLTRYDVARDAIAGMAQEVRALVGELEMLPTRGGAEVGISRVGRQLKELEIVLANMPSEPSATALKDAMMASYRVKQAVGKYSGFGKYEHLRTPGENALSELYESLRVGHENEAAFGEAARSVRENNAAFTDSFGRRKDVGSRFSVSIDQGPNGVPVAEFDAGKLKGFLGQLGGAEADQAVKSIETWLASMENRVAKLRATTEQTPEQAARLAEGVEALSEFRKVYKSALEKAETTNRLRASTLAEQGQGLGGLAGVIGDVVTRPHKTMERLGGVVQTLGKVTDVTKRAFRDFLETKPGTVGRTAAQIKPRPREKIIEDIENIRGLTSNPMALQAAADRMVGDLGQYAPKTADALRLSAQRVLHYLAREAPRASTSDTGLFGPPKGRYSDIQLHEWENKRNAALDARTPFFDLQKGTMNRDAIKAAEFAQPKLFAKLQEMALDDLQQMAAKGQLDKMPYEQKAQIATLLKIPADQTWTAPFIAMIQSSKQAPAPSNEQQMDGSQPVRKSNQRPLADQFMTAADQIEAGGV